MINEQEKRDWLDAFRAWFDQYREVLNDQSIMVEVPAETHGNGIYADLKSERYEVTVQLWNNGLSDFHVLDWRAADLEPDYQVEVTHHEFQSKSELFTELGTLVKRMSENDEPPFIINNQLISGYSKTVNFDPSMKELFPVPFAKGKSK